MELSSRRAGCRGRSPRRGYRGSPPVLENVGGWSGRDSGAGQDRPSAEGGRRPNQDHPSREGPGDPRFPPVYGANPFSSTLCGLTKPPSFRPRPVIQPASVNSPSAREAERTSGAAGRERAPLRGMRYCLVANPRRAYDNENPGSLRPHRRLIEAKVKGGQVEGATRPAACSLG